jgi:hypothetical protein
MYPSVGCCAGGCGTLHRTYFSYSGGPGYDYPWYDCDTDALSATSETEAMRACEAFVPQFSWLSNYACVDFSGFYEAVCAVNLNNNDLCDFVCWGYGSLGGQYPAVTMYNGGGDCKTLGSALDPNFQTWR